MFLLLILFTLGILLTGCSESSDDSISSIEDLNQSKYTIGSWLSNSSDAVLAEHFPNANVQHFEGFSQLITAIQGHKLDAILTTEVFYNSIPDKQGLRAIHSSSLGTSGFGFYFANTQKGQKLRAQMNEFIAENKNSNLREELDKAWTVEGANGGPISYGSSDKNAEEVVFAIEYTSPPFGYVNNGEVLGYDMAYVSKFCEKYGYHMVCKGLPYTMIAGGYNSGEYDLAGGALETPSAVSSDPFFSDWHYESPFVIIVNADIKNAGIFSSAGERMHNAFIKDDRWKVYIRGLITTLLITILSALAGSIIGLGMFLAVNERRKLLKKFFSLCTTVLHITPIPVLLMIFYYVVFDSVPISGTVVSIVVYTLIMSGVVYGLLNSSVSALDPGQWGAAVALGCTRYKTIFQVILPQAMRQFIPLYRSELINLIKLSSIVGFIAVEDLTKTADLIRAYTYDAIFPLIVTAIIYIILALVLIWAVNLIFRKTDPKVRSREKILSKIIPAGFDAEAVKIEKTENKNNKGTAITVENLCKSFGDIEILNGISTPIREGDVISIIGPSGCGKSTFLRCLNLMETVSSGNIYLNDVAITSDKISEFEVHKRIGMVFQHFYLFDHLTVLENVMFGPVKILKNKPSEVYPKAMALLEQIGMKDKAFMYPDDLSGGQKQRVAIARTIMMEPEIILFDEPTSALDPLLVREVENVIMQLKNSGYTMLIVTHEMRLAKEVANRVFYMDEKGIYEEGSPEQIFETPQRERTRLFVGRMKSYEVIISEENFDFVGIMSGIIAFGQTNFMPKRMADNACVIFEELCVQKLLHLPYAALNLRYSLSYSEKEESAEIRIGYDSPEELKFEEDNLSDILIKKAISSIREESSEDSRYTKNYVITIAK